MFSDLNNSLYHRLFKNYQWTASVQLHELGYHRAKGGLTVVNTTVTFDPTSGLASFQNLQITADGMYLLTFNVSTANDEYNFACVSNAITVTTAAPTYDVTLPPNYVIKYEGDYNAIDPNEIKANVYNFMTAYNISVAGVNTYSGSVYVTFYSSDFSSSLSDSLGTRGLSVDPNLRFSYASFNSIIINCTNCSVQIVQSDADAGLSGHAIIGICVGAGIAALFILVGLIVVIYGIRELTRISKLNFSFSSIEVKSIFLVSFI